MLVAAGIASLTLSIRAGRDTFQYLVAPPDMPGVKEEQPQQPAASEEGEQAEGAEQKKTTPQATPLEQALKQLRERMTGLETAVESFGITTYQSGAQLSTEEGGSAPAAVRGLWGDASLAERYVLSSGRQLYHEELQAGTNTAVIDEQLAIALFRVGDPVGRAFTLGGKTFQVVGVVRHRRHVGEADTALAMVPLLALDKAGIKPQVLAVNVLPKAGSGAYAAVGKELGQWRAGGSFHSLPKEQYRATLPLRWLLCGMGLMLAAIALKAARGITLSHWQAVTARLESRYALGLVPQMAGRFLLVAAMYGAILFGVFLLLQEAIAPVYMFPEWVPTVLVEPKDIQKAFWGVREQESVLVALRTPELLRLRFLHRLMTAASVAGALLLIQPMAKLRTWVGERFVRS